MKLYEPFFVWARVLYIFNTMKIFKDISCFSIFRYNIWLSNWLNGILEMTLSMANQPNIPRSSSHKVNTLFTEPQQPVSLIYCSAFKSKRELMYEMIQPFYQYISKYLYSFKEQINTSLYYEVPSYCNPLTYHLIH